MPWKGRLGQDTWRLPEAQRPHICLTITASHLLLSFAICEAMRLQQWKGASQLTTDPT